MAIEIGFNIISTIAIGLLFGMLIESIIFLVSFSLIRTYAGGYHASSAIRCYIFSMFVVIFVLFIQKFFLVYDITYLAALTLASLIIFMFAPQEDCNKPLDEIEQKTYKKYTYRYLIIEIIVVLITYFSGLMVLSKTISLGICMVAFALILGKIKNFKSADEVQET